MPFIVGRAAREYDLYQRVKNFVTGVGSVGRAYYTGSGNGKLLDIQLPAGGLTGESYTITCEAAASRGGGFGVVSSLRGVLADATVNQVYLDSQVQFYLDFGTTDYAPGDEYQLKIVDYSAPAKPKLTAVAGKVNTQTETITLTCTTAGQALIPSVQPEIPAVFSVAGSVSGAHGDYTQGTALDIPVLSLTLARGDTSNAGQQFALGDTVVVHTTRNPLRALNQHWVTRRDPKMGASNQFGTPIPESDSEWIFQGPGLAGTDEIMCGIRRSWNNGASTAAWELAGMRGYAAGLTYDEQPNILVANKRPYLLLWSGEISYWLSVTGRKITMKVRNNNYYMDMFLGLGAPWGSPKYQPYFLLCGGSAGNSETNWSSLSVANSNFWAARASDRERSPMMVLNRDGYWQGHVVRTNNSREDSWNGGGWMNSNLNSIWPYRGNGMQRVRENLDGSTPLLPVTLTPDLGEVDGYLAFSGYGNVQPEDIIIHTDTGKRYVAGTNVYRSSPEDFAGMELL